MVNKINQCDLNIYLDNIRTQLHIELYMNLSVSLYSVTYCDLRIPLDNQLNWQTSSVLRIQLEKDLNNVN